MTITISVGIAVGVIVGALWAFLRRIASKTTLRACEVILPPAVTAIFLYVNYLTADGVLNAFVTAAYYAALILGGVASEKAIEKIKKKKSRKD